MDQPETILIEKNNKNLLHQSFEIKGMTCEACVKTITAKLSALPGVVSAEVSLAQKKAHIESHRKISIEEVKQTLKDNPKYSVDEFKHASPLPPQKPEATDSVLKTYRPLITVFAFVALISAAYQVNIGHFHAEIFMNHLMAGFFIGLSFFKFLDLEAFSESFSSYDPIAQRWLGYGKVYPFAELILGLLFVAGKMLLIANITTVVILSITTYGVHLRLKSKSKFQCACLGTAFNLPLSNVTIGENVVMILMAAYNILGIGLNWMG